MKIFVTGPFRSGSTYMASLLNSQNDFACFEDYPWRHFKRNYVSIEEFDCHCARIEARFLDLGVPAPELRACKDYNDTIYRYVEHLKETYNVNNIGFKSCMHPQAEILKRVDEGYKVLIMKRDTAAILRSWLRRIDPSLAEASVQLQEYYSAIDHYDLSCYDGNAMVVDFKELTKNTKRCLENISEFLEYKVITPQVVYHSFSKGKQEFMVNSSFRGEAGASDCQLRSKLKLNFSENQILDVASRVDSGESLGLKVLLKSRLKKTAYFAKNMLDSARFNRVDW